MSGIERALREAWTGGDAAADRAAHAFAARADGLGLVDVAYATADSPLGALVLAATDRGLVRIAYADAGVDPTLEELARRISPRVLALPRRLDDARRQLDEYFGGGRRTFELALDLRLTEGFRRRVLEATAVIPYGAVATYGQVAADAGVARAARAAGSALRTNPLPIVIPCHRVVRAGGEMGEYAGGRARKQALIRLEADAQDG
jgi:methylated-DNA-[protein]-cysteine S-methyltransferase